MQYHTPVHHCFRPYNQEASLVYEPDHLDPSVEPTD